MQITPNPKWTKEQHEKFSEKVKANNGYCPCRLKKIPENKCMCKEFIESNSTGLCHCGRYFKKEL